MMQVEDFRCPDLYRVEVSWLAGTKRSEGIVALILKAVPLVSAVVERMQREYAPNDAFRSTAERSHLWVRTPTRHAACHAWSLQVINAQ